MPIAALKQQSNTTTAGMLQQMLTGDNSMPVTALHTFWLWCMQALALFLDCCRHRAIQPLAAAARASSPQSGLQDLLTKLAATVQVRPTHAVCLPAVRMLLHPP